MVNIFGRSEAVDSRVGEILAMDPLPETVWRQLGIRDDYGAEHLDQAGIEVVQDRCLKVDHTDLVTRSGNH